jgi:tetratricopeptide (TPR) repeat protein
LEATVGIGSFFRRLVGAEPSGGPLTGATTGELIRLWSARETLGPQTRNRTLDEICRRKLPLPFADIPDVYSPAAMGLDEVLDLQSLIELLRSQDPSSGTEPTIRVGRTSVLVPSGDHELVLVVMPGWREGGAAAPAPPPLEQDERVVAIVSVDCGDDVARAVAAQARAAGVPLHRLADLDGPLQIGALTLSPIDDAPGVVELVDDDDVFRVLIGTAIPLWAVPGPPETTHIIGAFRIPPTERDTDALTAADWTPAHACDIEACVLLSDVAGTSGYKSHALAMALLVPTRTLGVGLPVNAAAQPLLDAVLRGDAAALADLAAATDDEALTEAWHHLVVEGRLDDARRVNELSPDAPDAVFRRGILAELTGDLAGARAAYEEANSGETPHARAIAQLAYLDANAGRLDEARAHAARAVELLPDDVLVSANLAILCWMAGDRDAANLQLQTAHSAVGSWLGPLLEAVVHDLDPATADFGPLSAAAFELAPSATAQDHLRAGDHAEAERLLLRCLELQPRHTAALARLVVHLDQVGRGGEAHDLATKTLARLPAFAYLRAIRAVMRLRAGQDEDAISDLTLALDALPDHADWRINRVQALIRQGRAPEAHADLDVLDEGGTDRVLISSLRRAVDATRS